MKSHKQKSYFRLTGMNFFVYICLTIGLGLSQMLNLLSGVDDEQNILRTIKENIRSLLDSINENAIASTLLMLIIIIMVATLTMMITRKVLDYSSRTKDHIKVVSSTKHATAYDKGDYWSSAITSVLLRALTVATIIIYAAIWLMALFPAIKGLFYVETRESIPYEDIFVAVLALPLSLHVFVILFRALGHRFSF